MSSAYFNASNTASIEAFGFRITKDGAQIFRTMILVELELVLRAVPENAPPNPKPVLSSISMPA